MVVTVNPFDTYLIRTCYRSHRVTSLPFWRCVYSNMTEFVKSVFSNALLLRVPPV